MVQDYSAAEGLPEWRILGHLLTRCSNKKARDFGKELWSENDSAAADTHIPIDTAMAVLVDSSLGRLTYTNQRKILKLTGHDILPPWINIRKEQSVISPEPERLPEPHIGVYLPFTKSMQLTAERIMDDIPENVPASGVVMNIKYGFDGSGSHAIYRQLNNERTNNIILTMFCPLRITSESGGTVWEQRSPSNPLTHRPLALQMGKESADSLQSLSIFNCDQTLLKSVGCSIVVGNLEIPLKVNVVSHMMDMKAAHLYLGLGGAYCDLCDSSRGQCHDPERVEQGFEITRNVEDLHNLFNELVQEDGTVMKRPHDYEERGGLVNKPIPTNEVFSVQVLHALLRTFDHFMKVAVHLRAGVLDWAESPTSINKQFLVKAKTEIQKKIEEGIGEQWNFPDQTGKGGTTTTGNTARKILHHGRNFVIEMIPQHYQDIMKQFGQQLSVIIQVCSSSEMVNVAEFKKLCTGFYLFLIKSFPRVTN